LATQLGLQVSRTHSPEQQSEPCVQYPSEQAQVPPEVHAPLQHSPAAAHGCPGGWHGALHLK
jgi:hypothetical protein